MPQLSKLAWDGGLLLLLPRAGGRSLRDNAAVAESTRACNGSDYATTPPSARVQEEAAAQQADFDAKEALREKRRKEQVG